MCAGDFQRNFLEFWTGDKEVSHQSNAERVECFQKLSRWRTHPSQNIQSVQPSRSKRWASKSGLQTVSTVPFQAQILSFLQFYLYLQDKQVKESLDLINNSLYTTCTRYKIHSMKKYSVFKVKLEKTVKIQR